MIKATLEGDIELARLLKDLGQNAIKDSQIKQGLRHLAKPIIADLKKEVPYKTGNLSKSFGVIRGIKTKKGRPAVLIGPRYYEPYKGFHAHLVEVGNKEYDVTFDGSRDIYNVFMNNKTKTQNELEKLVIGLLEKKLAKLRK
tara:strand:+ start:6222 stop:6647 length:426 start_codon:yes stop_codon:yes gene_type:complete